MIDLDDPEDPDRSQARVSDAAERQRLLAATLAHAVARDAEYREAPVAPGRQAAWWKWGSALGLLAAAGLALVAPPARLAGPPLPAVSEAEVEQGLERALFLQSGEIEAFRIREGRLPRTLDELDGTLPGIRYVRSNNRVYQLVVARPDGSALVWDSADPSPVRRNLGERWLQAPWVP